MPPDPSSEQSKITESAKAEASSWFCAWLPF
jgi:hypothetical protein